MECDQIIFSGHAVMRMYERSIQTSEVIQVVRHGRIIREYTDDKPFPSFLIMGSSPERILHIVIAYDIHNARCIIITVYEPDPDLWNGSFENRR